MAKQKTPNQGYSSPVNIGLAQLPKTSDPNLFNEMVEVYNAIHILNAYINQLRLSIEGGDSSELPSESMRITRGFWVTCGPEKEIKTGMVVSIYNGKLWPGVNPLLTTIFDGMYWQSNYITGIAMTAGKPGDKVKMGIGPAILEVKDTVVNQWVWATDIFAPAAGSLLREPAPDNFSFRIGRIIMENMMLFTPEFAIVTSNNEPWANPSPPPP